LGCGVSQTWLCEDCQRQLIIDNNHSCYICRRPSLQGETHKQCDINKSLDGLVVACHQTSLLKDLIHTFKYEHVVDLATKLAGLMLKKIELSPIINSLLLNPETTLIPVPLHRVKEWERGYNQAQLLAQELAINYPAQILDNVVMRQKFTKTQTELPRERRLVNIKNAFRVVKPELIKNKSVVLVDDVLTTGSTLTELALACKQSGAKEVWAVVITRD
jgi:ComF family protein